MFTMTSSPHGRTAVALPDSSWSRHTKPGARSARALTASSWETKPASSGESTGAASRAMFSCARWKGPSVEEMAYAGEVHGHPGGHRGGHDLVVTHRAAGLHDRSHPGAHQDLGPVGEREERVRGGHRAG